jgi:hypothetical protein
MSRWIDPRSLATHLFPAGLLVLGLGLVARSQSTDPPNPLPTLPTYVPVSGGFGTADSNGTMIAVTGVDVTGGSLLFLIDTQSRNLSVYSAQSGSASQSEVKWVGARNIDLDLQVDGFNDKSTIVYKELKRRFAEDGASAASK